MSATSFGTVSPEFPPEVWGQVVQYKERWLVLDLIFDRLPKIALTSKNTMKGCILAKKDTLSDLTLNKENINAGLTYALVRALDFEKSIRLEDIFDVEVIRNLKRDKEMFKWREQQAKSCIVWDCRERIYAFGKGTDDWRISGNRGWLLALQNESGVMISRDPLKNIKKLSKGKFEATPRLEKRIKKYIPPGDNGEALVALYDASKNRNYTKLFKIALNLSLCNGFIDRIAKMAYVEHYLLTLMPTIRRCKDQTASLDQRERTALIYVIGDGDSPAPGLLDLISRFFYAPKVVPEPRFLIDVFKKSVRGHEGINSRYKDGDQVNNRLIEILLSNESGEKKLDVIALWFALMHISYHHKALKYASKLALPQGYLSYLKERSQEKRDFFK